MPLPVPNAISGVSSAIPQASEGNAGAGLTSGLPSVGSVIPGVADIGHFFDLLSSGALWIRAVEIILGAGLIIVGLATLVSGTPVGQAAARAGKAAAIL
jgi:hypothetical protein